MEIRQPIHSDHVRTLDNDPANDVNGYTVAVDGGWLAR
jgi:hypothetical protein